jgi:hypothetical protein
VLNAKSAEIFGNQTELFLGGDYLANNRGTIIGAEHAGIQLGKNTSGGVVNNYGYVFGQIDGVSDISLDGPATIHNYKTIRSDDTGIEIHTDPAITTSITNAVGAVIDGGTHGVYCDRGAFKLVNRGTIIGSVDDADGANAGQLSAISDAAMLVSLGVAVGKPSLIKRRLRSASEASRGS